MTSFLNDTDARRFEIRRLYYEYLGPGPGGREPESGDVINGWLNVWAAHGGETVEFNIRDSQEAQNRAGRGVAAINKILGLQSRDAAAIDPQPYTLGPDGLPIGRPDPNNIKLLD